MKSIISIGIGILLTASLFSGISLSGHHNNTAIKLVCTDPDPDENSLKQSAAIISKRLEDSGFGNFNIDISGSENSITIKSDSDYPPEDITELATAKGNLAFYETVREPDAIKQLRQNKQLAGLLIRPGQGTQSPENYPGAEVGRCNASDMSRVEKILGGIKVNSEDPVCFLWSTLPDESGLYSLYLLKDKPVLGGKYISDSNVSDMKGQPVSIMVNFSDEGAERWAALTGQNINKPLALVMDRTVIFAPVVRDAIKGGRCMITGNFSEKEANRINVLIKYGELPLDFKIAE